MINLDKYEGHSGFTGGTRQYNHAAISLNIMNVNFGKMRLSSRAYALLDPTIDRFAKLQFGKDRTILIEMMKSDIAEESTSQIIYNHQRKYATISCTSFMRTFKIKVFSGIKVEFEESDGRRFLLSKPISGGKK